MGSGASLDRESRDVYKRYVYAAVARKEAPTADDAGAGVVAVHRPGDAEDPKAAPAANHGGIIGAGSQGRAQGHGEQLRDTEPEKARAQAENGAAATQMQGDGRCSPDLEEDDDDALPQGQRDILRGLREGDYKPWLLAEHLHGDGAFVLKAMTANGLALSYATQELKADRDFVLAALHSAGAEAEAAWDYVAKELKSNAEVVAAAVRWSPEVLQKAPEALRGSRNFVKRLVRETKASWLLEWATEELRNDVALRKECQELAGTGVVFTYYQSCNAFEAMRYSFKASGASVPGGEAYEAVMKELREAAHGSTATVWFGETLVFGSFADSDQWVHPPYACGRDNTPVPPLAEQDRKWRSLVESQCDRKDPEVGSRYPCWCCHWLAEVRRQHEQGAVICISVSNIYSASWVDKYNAGSSELSDADAERLDLPKEEFKNGKPPGWGEGQVQIPYSGTFERKAPIHSHTAKPLGTGCRWERSVLDQQSFPVYAFFMP